MSTKRKIAKISIKGFQSIKSLDEFVLGNLNVLIGANGVGKSNFVNYFRMLGELVERRLRIWVARQGSVERVLTYGLKNTSEMSSFVEFGRNGYKFKLEPSANGQFIFAEEKLFFDGYYGIKWVDLGSGHLEANLEERYKRDTKGNVSDYVYSSISSWKVYHFHDTSDSAGVKQLHSLHDNKYLRQDARNLAAFLYQLRDNHLETYQQIRKTVKLVIPFFDDFVLEPVGLPTGEQQIRLLWKQINSDYPLWSSQLSDGSIRFICLTTALLQPDPPSTIIIDEPELGLHPYAITLLGSLIRSASTRMQIIISTQSVPLLNEFSIEDLIVVERENGVSVFKRLDEAEFELWLEDYTVGELWEKNILGGRPTR